MYKEMQVFNPYNDLQMTEKLKLFVIWTYIVSFVH